MIACWVGWLNANSGAVTAVATVVLVGVTTFYAWRTHVMAKTMAQQHALQLLQTHAQLAAVIMEAEEASQEAIQANLDARSNKQPFVVRESGLTPKQLSSLREHYDRIDRKLARAAESD